MLQGKAQCSTVQISDRVHSILNTCAEHFGERMRQAPLPAEDSRLHSPSAGSSLANQENGEPFWMPASAVLGNKLRWLAQKNSEVLQPVRGKTKDSFLALIFSLSSIFLYCFYPPYPPQTHTPSSLQVCHRLRKTILPKNQSYSRSESYRKSQLKKQEIQTLPKTICEMFCLKHSKYVLG